ncbi:monooxygenase [Aspergillus sclerotioniger CBS 115572]|uniref:Monooxygenase n=1 Tax=Aspergillus sclerotioniger CBS 115572 TaxID=1450535 RepID=A0A317VSE4_9EURO|nr:monooxygenase [Aspergillus sclerotioniger CBS 115572]PWY77304.1 monooxygenase [Aspergillus sclerotioniger CBS 115572]
MDPLQADAIHNERHVKVISVGAGASGLCLAYKLQRSFQNWDLTIYEKNPEIAGTWYENRYPGCACDVPSHNYVYSFEPKSDWSSVYASSSEIRGYFNDFVDKYGLRKHILTSHMVTEARWFEESGRWEVTVTDLTTDQTVHNWCHILVHATGYLNKPSWPELPGLADFKGIKLHSAMYDESVSLEGKNVLLIGAGSSAVQILPAIQPIVNRVKIFIRSPTWLLPDISTEAGKFSQDQIERFVNNPESVMELRQDNERTMNSIFTMYLKDTVLQEQAKGLLTSVMKNAFQDQEMEDRLIPKFAVGCKRVVPSGFKYLKTLKKENVDVVYGGVTSVTPSGCISDDGQEHEGDILICATGFDTSYIPRYPILGPNGRNLQTEWADSIMGYMGVGISEFPNTFTMLGPYTPVSNGPTMVAIEAQADYICSFIDRYQTEPIHSMALRQDVCAEFKEHVGSAMQKAVWTDNCRNSHNNHTIGGRIPTTWPGSTLHYLEAIREPRADDWEIQYTGNRFSWLGIGVSQTEWDPTADLAYYIRQSDDGQWNSRRKRNLAIAKTGSMAPRALHRQPKLAAKEKASDKTAAVATAEPVPEVEA